MKQKNKYRNFHEALKKEKNPIAQEHLTAFYNKKMKGYEIQEVPYEDFYERCFQRSGVDKILYKGDKENFKYFYIQEKVLDSNYPNVMFEYKRKSGKDGWAICEDEISHYTVIYMAGEILVFDTKELRKWLTSNLEQFKEKYYYKTDNHNVNIPKSIIYDSLDVKVYKLKDYWEQEIDDDNWMKEFEDEIL
jgi:hypothetical protein